MSPTDSTVLAILAGGEGARMGKAKGLLHIESQPILEYLLDRLAWPGPAWLITAPGRERPPGHRRFTRELVDPAPGIGPLRGILTALEQLDAPDIVIATVDMPGITSDALRWIITELHRRPDAQGLMCRRQPGSQQRPEPFPLALRKSAEPLIRARLDAGHRAVHRLADDPAFLVVPAPPEWRPTFWLNLNEPSDLASLPPPPIV